MNNPPSGTVPQAECPRCDEPLPKVIYGYPNWSALMLLRSEGVRYVLGGCEPHVPVRIECPRCGLDDRWIPQSGGFSRSD